MKPKGVGVIRMILFFMVYLSMNLSLAHPGPTDKEGCHINSDTGRKHCHSLKEIKEEKQKAIESEKRKEDSQKPSLEAQSRKFNRDKI